MWPKVLAQLIELLPHAARLLPMADRFFQAKGQGDEATLKALEGLRGDVGQTTAAHASLYRQMNELAEKADAAAEEARAARTAVVAVETRIGALEVSVRKLERLLWLSLLLGAITVAILVVRK